MSDSCQKKPQVQLLKMYLLKNKSLLFNKASLFPINFSEDSIPFWFATLLFLVL